MKINEEIWNSIYSEKERIQSKEDSKVLSKLIDKQDEIYKMIGEEVREIFDEYSVLSNELCAIYERESFCQGVKFGVRFMIEILS